MEILTERQKQALRYIVKAIREKEIDDEFTFCANGGVPYISRQGEPIWTPQVTALSMDALERSGLIFSYIHLATTTTGSNQYQREDQRDCYVTPAGYAAVDSDFSPIKDLTYGRPPIEITESLKRFRSDFPDPTRLAFVMMSFADTKPHGKIHECVRAALDPHSFIALRADDKQYHDDLFYNILTYIYGCRFGIAVFERIEADSFNPNVSLEIGYMLGLGKSVCLLKDKSLRLLPPRTQPPFEQVGASAFAVSRLVPMKSRYRIGYGRCFGNVRFSNGLTDRGENGHRRREFG